MLVLLFALLCAVETAPTSPPEAWPTGAAFSLPGVCAVETAPLTTGVPEAWPTSAAGRAGRLEAARESLTGMHCRYRVYVDGLPSDDVVVRPCESGATGFSLSSTETDRPGAPAPQDRWLDGRRVRRTIVYETPIEPWAEDVDVHTGDVVRRFPLFYRATKPARVFDVNPVVARNDPSLQDRNDSAAAVPAGAYREVQLEDVAESGALRGPYISLIDRQPRAIAPPDASGSLIFDREQDGFEDVQAYFHIDRNQRYLQSLGYTGSRAIAPYAIEVDAHATSGSDNSLFLPSLSQVGRGTLYFGEGGTDDAEDADLLVHEYGHALLEWIAPGAFGGANSGEARALGEGFCDYWAYSAHSGARVATGRDPFCFADWDARCWEDDPAEQCSYGPGSDCLRRLDSTRTMADYDRTTRTGVEHQNGTIWSSALREIRQAVGREVADTIFLEANFDVEAQPTFASVARLILRADRSLYGGEHASAICAAMTSRRILADCGQEPRGELTVFQAADRGVAIADLATITSTITIADPRAIERVLVRVDLEHGARGDLRIELIAPDGTTVTLQRPSIDRGRELHATYGLTATPSESLDVLRGRAAAGTWQLRITDERSRDAGTLLSWGLLLQFAGDARAETRPRAEKTQMIPVVAHIFGANDTAFRSDVRIANITSSRVIATLILTPTGRDGTTTFAAVRAGLEPGQTLALDDIVESAFGLSGSGSLEILGDVIAMSRMVTMRNGGTVGQQIPPSREVATRDAPLVVASIGDYATRVNLGLTNTSASRVDAFAGTRSISVAPFSHHQFAVPSGVYEIRANAGITAYLSQIDNTTGDAMFIPAVGVGPKPGIAPAIRQQGADREWSSDLWIGNVGTSTVVTLSAVTEEETASLCLFLPVPPSTLTYLGILTRFSSSMSLAAIRLPIVRGTFAGTRVATDGMSEFIPLLDPHGPPRQHLVFIDTVAPYRTNVGFVSENAATAEVVVYDAAGTEVERFTLSTRGGVAQTVAARAVSNGRAAVRFLSGTGRAYASLIDGRTGDATFVAGQ